MGTGSMTSLKLADKHVREGNFAAALALIQKARSEDPSNRYAEAYEERVRSLMDSPVAAEGAADRPDVNRSSAGQPSSPPPLAEIVGFLSRAYDALSNNDYLGALDILGQARQLDPTNADIPVLEEQIQAACSAPPTASTPDIHYQIVRDTIQAYIQEACDLASRGEFDEAMHLVARGFTLDPLDPGLRECERLIINARDEAQAEEEERAAVRQRLAQEAEAEALRLEAEEQEQAEVVDQIHEEQEPVRPLSREEQLELHVTRARDLMAVASFDDALTEIALGLILDPRSTPLLALEQLIWQEKNDREAAETTAHSSGENVRLIRLHILAAEEFARNGDFTRALDGVAKAFVLDPTNTDVKRAEVRIRQQELRHHQQSANPPLKLIYHHDRAANGE